MRADLALLLLMPLFATATVGMPGLEGAEAVVLTQPGAFLLQGTELFYWYIVEPSNIVLSVEQVAEGLWTATMAQDSLEWIAFHTAGQPRGATHGLVFRLEGTPETGFTGRGLHPWICVSSIHIGPFGEGADIPVRGGMNGALTSCGYSWLGTVSIVTEV